MVNHRLLATVLICVGLALGGASRSPAQQTPRFRTGVELVGLDVCVKDGFGRLVTNLDANDFLILEDGEPQRIALFAPGARVPLAIVLLIDQSASMSDGKLDRAKVAAAGFVQALRPDDLVEVMGFNERADRRVPFVTDRGAAEQAIASLSATGQTALFDAVATALSDIRVARKSWTTEYQEAVVVLSDGEDSSSLLEFEDVLDEARRSGVMIYTVSITRADDGSPAPPRELWRLATDTGGRAITVTNASALDTTYREIGAELRHLYRLAYVPPDAAQDGAWRTISVRVLRADARARTRAGYYRPRRLPLFLQP
jgi:Ca-activated chloride channel family protein